MPYRVKGSTLSSKLQWVTERFGTEAAELLRADVPDLPAPLLDTSWVTYDCYLALLEAITTRFFAGDRTGVREIGLDSARRALAGPYRAFAASGDFVAFLGRIARLHASFYSDGTMTVDVGADEQSCTISLSGAPRYDAVDMELATGFYTGAAEAMGTQLVHCAYRRLDAAIEFDLGWR